MPGLFSVSCPDPGRRGPEFEVNPLLGVHIPHYAPKAASAEARVSKRVQIKGIIMKIFAVSALAMGISVFAAPVTAAPLVVYNNNFDSAATTGGGATATLTNLTTTTSTAASALYGRNADASTSVLTLSNLAAHNSIDFDLNLWFVDSWDGTGAGTFEGDYLYLTIDGTQVAQLSVNNFNNSEFAVPGGVELQFGNFTVSGFNDRFVSMNSAGYLSFAHTASSIQLGLRAGGPGFQYGDDESWGIDDIKVTINTVGAGGVPEPATWAMMIGGFGLVGGALRRRTASFGTA